LIFFSLNSKLQQIKPWTKSQHRTQSPPSQKSNCAVSHPLPHPSPPPVPSGDYEKLMSKLEPFRFKRLNGSIGMFECPIALDNIGCLCCSPLSGPIGYKTPFDAFLSLSGEAKVYKEEHNQIFNVQGRTIGDFLNWANENYKDEKKFSIIY
jgi:hypothetical protein